MTHLTGRLAAAALIAALASPAAAQIDGLAIMAPAAPGGNPFRGAPPVAKAPLQRQDHRCSNPISSMSTALSSR